jgi:DNA-binding CsgD family transcriptional regulator
VPRSLGATLETVLAARGEADKLMAIVHRSRIPMTIFDDERRYVEANRPAQLLARSSLAELRQLTVDDLTPPEGHPIVEAVWTRMLETGLVTGLGPWGRAGRDGAPLEIAYWGVANALPGQHLVAFAPSDWLEEELGALEGETAAPPDSPLTPRQLEVLQLAAEGLPGPSIAERLVLSPATVKTHFGNIYKKLGVSGRGAAVARGMRWGLID